MGWQPRPPSIGLRSRLRKGLWDREEGKKGRGIGERRLSPSPSPLLFAPATQATQYFTLASSKIVWPDVNCLTLTSKQLMNEAEYLMKNYGDRGGCYPPRPTASMDNTLRDLHNSSYDMKAEFNNCFIIHSK